MGMRKEKEKEKEKNDSKSGADIGKIVQLMSGDTNRVANMVSGLYMLYVRLSSSFSSPNSTVSTISRLHHTKPLLDLDNELTITPGRTLRNNNSNDIPLQPPRHISFRRNPMPLYRITSQFLPRPSIPADSKGFIGGEG